MPFLGNCPLFDWDEINFAECAREMLVSGNYERVQLNFQPFWEKPPVFIWMQAFFMNIFGVNEFAARFPNALCSIITLLFLFHAGKKFHSTQFAWLWVLLYISLILPHLYFRSGIIDPWFNLFIFYAIYQLMKILNSIGGKSEISAALLAGISLGLAVLTKGPAAILIVGLVILFVVVQTKNFQIVKRKSFLSFVMATGVVSLSWFMVEWLRGNGDVISEFINYQKRLFNTGDAGHDGPFYYHVLVLLLGCFPASVIFIFLFRNKENLTPFQLLFRKTMLVLFWVVLILFSIVKTKIVHYSSLCYFPLTFITTIGIMQYSGRLQNNKSFRFLFWLVAILFTMALLAISSIRFWKENLIQSGLIKDAFAQANLNADVSWSGFEFLLVPLFVIASFIMFKGLRMNNLKKVLAAMMLLIVFITMATAILIPRVEMYSQHAAIAFYKACAKHSCYVETHGFKSYAYLFYSDRKPDDFSNPQQKQFIEKFINEREGEGKVRYAYYSNAYCHWMKYEKIDRPAYLVCKTKQEDEMNEIGSFNKLYDQNGYSFYVRMP